MGVPTPVTPEVVCVIAGEYSVLIHSVGVSEASPTLIIGVTVMIPQARISLQPPVNGIQYSKVPATVGVPLMVMVLAVQEAVTPSGKPSGAAIPVAPVVVIVILGESGVLIHNVGISGVVTVFHCVTVILPVAFIVPQSPISGIV